MQSCGAELAESAVAPEQLTALLLHIQILSPSLQKNESACRSAPRPFVDPVEARLEPSPQPTETTMRVMVIVKATKNSEAGLMPSEDLLTQMGKYNEELVKAGVMLAGEGLHPSSKGKRVQFTRSKRTVVDGPFSETKELVAGFWLWQVKSIEEAVEWVKRCPEPMPGEETTLEIRPVFDAEDFAASDPTGELRKKEDELRKAVERR
jgi:hypothetical protein